MKIISQRINKGKYTAQYKERYTDIKYHYDLLKLWKYEKVHTQSPTHARARRHITA